MLAERGFLLRAAKTPRSGVNQLVRSASRLLPWNRSPVCTAPNDQNRLHTRALVLDYFSLRHPFNSPMEPRQAHRCNKAQARSPAKNWAKFIFRNDIFSSPWHGLDAAAKKAKLRNMAYPVAAVASGILCETCHRAHSLA